MSGRNGNQGSLFGPPHTCPDTLADARAMVKRRRIEPEGVQCPCCDQFSKEYRRVLNSGMARALIRAYLCDLREPGEWIDHRVLERADPSRDFTRLRHWGLLEPHAEAVGMWRITGKGEEFVLERSTVPSHILTYDDVLTGTSAERTGIRGALGRKFNYDTLMADARRPTDSDTRGATG